MRIPPSSGARHAVRPRLALIGAIAAAPTATACAASGPGSTSGSGGANAWATVNVGIALSPPKAIFMGPYVTQAKGFFAKEHLPAFSQIADPSYANEAAAQLGSS